jgi:DNA-binding SARP family transcriptional activator
MIERTERLAQLLHDAILIAETSRDDTLIRHLRGARFALRDEAHHSAVRIDLLSGRVLARGVPVALSKAELAVVIALALHERGVPRDLLTDELYPDAEPLAAGKSLKVNVHRVRRRIGSADVIRYAAGRYGLGDEVDVELPRIEAEVRRAQLEPELSSELRDRLERLRQRIRDGRPAFVLEWAWFDEVERRLTELGRLLALILARDALRRKRFERAIDLATELVHDDPLDENAAEIAIRALLEAGDRTAALLEYRRYASVLRREIQTNPSDGLRALVEDGISAHSVQP